MWERMLWRGCDYGRCPRRRGVGAEPLALSHGVQAWIEPRPTDSAADASATASHPPPPLLTPPPPLLTPPPLLLTAAADAFGR